MKLFNWELCADSIKFVTVVSFGLLTLFGALCQAFDGLSRWISEKAQVVLKPKSVLVRIAIITLMLLWVFGAIQLSIDLWKGIRKGDPVKAEALALSRAIEADVNRGIAPGKIYLRYNRNIETIIPMLLGSGDSPELNALSKVYEAVDSGNTGYTNLAAHIRRAANSLK